MNRDKSGNGFDEGEETVPLPRKNIENRRGLIGVIHVDTSTVHFSVYTTTDYKQLLDAKEEIQLSMPQDGWFEEDALEIMSAVYQCCSDLCSLLPSQGHRQEDIICVAVTNQRETTVMWDALTGQPLYKAIVWNDIRTSRIADTILKKLSKAQIDVLKKLSGLPVSPYFSALKIRWLMENVPAVQKALRKGICKAGTLDSWIVWNLTKGKLHITDVTNASRTMLMNIKTLTWDPELLKVFGISGTILPQVRSSSEIYGRITASRSVLREVFICGLIGDQQASLVGQMCLERGQANCNYNLGCFLLCNTGLQRVESPRGLLTTVAYKMGPNARAVYAIEGSVAVGGRAFEWLSTKVQLLPNADEAEIYAKSVSSTAGLYFVPAFTGLYAPYWCKSARGIIVGLTKTHTAKHVVRAAHEAICYQVRDILECMRNDCGIKLSVLHADGKLSANKTLMQLQADISGIPIAMSLRPDCAALGAAMCAAHAYSFDLTSIKSAKQNMTHMSFTPTSTGKVREIEYQKWHRAVERSRGWADLRYPKKKRRWWWYSLISLLFIILLVAAMYYDLQKHLYGSFLSKQIPLCPPYIGRRARRRLQRKGLL